MIISHIVAVAKDWSIGQNNDLMWRLSADLKKFKSITSGHHILLGRKNYESIGRPLPNRVSLVVSRDSNLSIEGVSCFTNIDAAIQAAKEAGEKELFIIGGGEIYKQTMNIIDKVYLTIVDATFDKADTFYPELNLNDWDIAEKEKFSKDEKNEYDFSFMTLSKKNK